MPAKKAPAKPRSQHSISGETANRQHVLTIQEGNDILGTFSIDSFLQDAPKASDIFTQFCATGNTTNERAKTRQNQVRTIKFKRLSTIGLQFGEIGNSNAKPIPLPDLEAELGAVSQNVGTVSLCRSSDGFDGGNFFICMTSDPTETAHIAKHYVGFGRVSGNMDVLKQLCDKLLEYTGDDGVIDNSACPIQISDLFHSS